MVRSATAGPPGGFFSGELAGKLAPFSNIVLTRPMKEITLPLSVMSTASASIVVPGIETLTGSFEASVPALKSMRADFSQACWLLSVRT
jgi:hypothetical protein